MVVKEEQETMKKENYNNNHEVNKAPYEAETSKDNETSLVFTLKQQPGALVETLKVFKDHNVNLSHIESRPSKQHHGHYEFLVEFSNDADPKRVCEVIELFKQKAENVIVHHQNKHDAVPWFPKQIRDIDQFANRILSYGAELDSDHPGFTDQIYRERRKQFADIAFNYRHGEPIPRVEYTDEEISTWRVIYEELIDLYPTHACAEFNYIFPLLQQNCGYSANSIPQLQDVSDFLKSCTGFRLRPVAGLLSPRDFLAGLAFRVFHSTQYIRHPSVPKYTPEPDVCHELLGHAPLFADPDFAQFSHEIGLASLGTSDEVIERLSTVLLLYHNPYSVQPEMAPFDPAVTADTKYPITSYQPKYFIADSFADAKLKLTNWASSIPRPFHVRYNPYTERIEILDKVASVSRLVKDIKSDFCTLEDALNKLNHITTSS